MRTPNESDLAETPRWRLWVVALVAFGPAMATWLTGVLYSLFWANVLVVWLTEPERLPIPASDEIWGVATPIALVAAGFVGLVGLLRVLTLPRGERPTSQLWCFPLIDAVTSSSPFWRILGAMALGAALHVLFLSRKTLFPAAYGP